MKFVADKGIVLEDYANKEAPIANVPQTATDPKYAYLDSQRRSGVRDKFIAKKTRDEWQRRLSLLVEIVSDI